MLGGFGDIHLPNSLTQSSSRLESTTYITDRLSGNASPLAATQEYTYIHTHTHVEQLCLCRTAFSTQYDGECVNVSVYLLSSVPLIRLPQARRGSRRQQAVKGKPKHLIDAPHKVQTSHNLFFQLGKKKEKSGRGQHEDIIITEKCTQLRDQQQLRV